MNDFHRWLQWNDPAVMRLLCACCNTFPVRDAPFVRLSFVLADIGYGNRKLIRALRGNDVLFALYLCETTLIWALDKENFVPLPQEWRGWLIWNDCTVLKLMRECLCVFPIGKAPFVIVADALEDAGCNDPNAISSLRSSNWAAARHWCLWANYWAKEEGL